MDILDDLREIDLAAPEKPDSKVKRLIITIMSIFLVVLMLSYIVVSYPISDIIRGQLESNPLQDNKIILQDFTIHLENKTYQQLRTIYHQEQKKEFSVCLLGKKEEIESLKGFIKKAELSKIQETVLMELYGITDNMHLVEKPPPKKRIIQKRLEKNMEDVAEIIYKLEITKRKFSRERIRQIEASALEKIRNVLPKDLLEMISGKRRPEQDLNLRPHG